MGQRIVQEILGKLHGSLVILHNVHGNLVLRFPNVELLELRNTNSSVQQLLAEILRKMHVNLVLVLPQILQTFRGSVVIRLPTLEFLQQQRNQDIYSILREILRKIHPSLVVQLPTGRSLDRDHQEFLRTIRGNFVLRFPNLELIMEPSDHRVLFRILRKIHADLVLRLPSLDVLWRTGDDGLPQILHQILHQINGNLVLRFPNLEFLSRSYLDVFR